jgi:GAF domain-containing protein
VQVIEASYRLLDAERVTMFLLDSTARFLVIAHSADAEGVRIPVSNGLAGYCASHNAPVVVHDAYADDRFDQSVDAATGFRTHSVLCVPIRDSSGAVVGVLQVRVLLSDPLSCLSKPASHVASMDHFSTRRTHKSCLRPSFAGD